MFERKFEFIVHQPLEVCEQRVLEMEKSGCYLLSFYKISTNVLSTSDASYSEIYLEQLLGRRNKVHIEAIIEAIDPTTTKVSGVAVPHGYQAVVWIYVCATCFLGILVMLNGDWYSTIPVVGFSFIITALFTIQGINYRNRLIKSLEKALTQPKKKKNEVV